MTTLDNEMVTPGYTPEQLRYFRRCGAKSKGHKGRTLTPEQARAARAVRTENARARKMANIGPVVGTPQAAKC